MRPGGTLRAVRGTAFGATNGPDWLARSYRSTDKVAHGYLHYYRAHFGPLRFRRMTVLEIGVGGYDAPSPGGSLALWRDYFPRSTIVGMDLHPKAVAFGPRVKFEQGDQSSVADLQALVDRHGVPSVVIDDGSHVAEHIQASFAFLWPLLSAGGIYVIEDLCTSYHRDFGGGRPAPPESAIGLLQSLAGDTQAQDPAYAHADFAEYRLGDAPEALHERVAAVHVYPGIAFIEKA